MTVSLQFVHVSTAADGQPGALSAVDQRAIRSQAMKDFRRRQREAATSGHLRTSRASSSNPVSDRQSSDSKTQSPENIIRLATHSDTSNPDRKQATQPLARGSKARPPLCTSCLISDLVEQSNRANSHCDDCLRIRHFLARRGAQITLPQTIRSPAMLREPMLQSFIEVFYPSCIWSNPRMIGVLSTWATARSQATLYINDAVGLTHMGFTGSDPRLVMEGRKRHVMAASSLRREMNDPNTPIEINASAVMSMMMAEIYSATSSGMTGCATHLAGVTAILHAHLSQLNARPVHPGVITMYHRLILVQGMIHRRAISVDEHLTASGTPYAAGSIEALVRLGLSLPGLIETTDCRSGIETRRLEYAEATESPKALALRLGLQLDTWLQDYQNCGFRYRQTPLEFRTPVDGNVLGLYWSLRLLLAESLYLLNSCEPPTATRHHEMQLARSEASMYAALLRETAIVLQNGEGAQLSKALGMRAPLHFAKQWWIRLGDKAQVHEIEAMERQLQADLPGIEWISLLYWSFMAASWLERI